MTAPTASVTAASATTPASTGTPTTPSGPTGCTAGPVTVTWAPDRPPPERVCVRVGSEITVAMRPVENSRWQQVASSDPRVAAVGPLEFDQDGTSYVTVTAVRAGTAIVAAAAR